MAGRGEGPSLAFCGHPCWGAEHLVTAWGVQVGVGAEVLCCSFPGPVGRDGRLVEGFTIFLCPLVFWLQLLQLRIPDVLDKHRTQGAQHWVLPRPQSACPLLSTLQAALMSRVLVVLSQRNREKYV